MSLSEHGAPRTRPRPGTGDSPLRGRTVIVTQPYVPAYRVPLFDELDTRLRAVGATLEVHTGEPSGDQRLRADAATGPWHRKLGVREVRIGSHSVPIRKFLEPVPDAALLVTEFAGLNNLAWANVGHRPVILWGHGRRYVAAESALSDRLKWMLARRADHVMTYSPSGRDWLIDRGRLPGDRVTAVGNSTDTAGLTRALRSIDHHRSSELRSRFPRAPRALFVGGLDRTKRIDFLVDAAHAAARLDPAFQLIVIGRGKDEAQLEPLVSSDVVVHVHEARGLALAELASVSRAIWMPGRVGLVAVDALALGLEVHTVQHDFHAPEIEFLGEHVRFIDDDPARFAQRSLELMYRSPDGPMRPVAEGIPSIAATAEHILRVLVAAAERST